MFINNKLELIVELAHARGHVIVRRTYSGAINPRKIYQSVFHPQCVMKTSVVHRHNTIHFEIIEAGPNSPHFGSCANCGKPVWSAR